VCPEVRTAVLAAPYHVPIHGITSADLCDACLSVTGPDDTEMREVEANIANQELQWQQMQLGEARA